ncbi:hypothetical protein Tco_1140733 [Tanacetum coccineum]
MKSRNRVNSYAARITKMIADIEDRHHGPIDIEQVAASSSLRLLEPKRTIESRAKRSSINLVRTQHPSDTKDILKMEMEMEIRSTSDINAQDGDPLQDDVRLCLGDDLKKAQDHSQRQSWGITAGIHGLFSGWYCGLAGRKVTLRVSMAWAKGVTTGTLVRYETSCMDCIGLDCIGLVVHASLYDSSFIVLQCFLYYHSEYRDDKKDVRKSGLRDPRHCLWSCLF